MGEHMPGPDVDVVDQLQCLLELISIFCGVDHRAGLCGHVGFLSWPFGGGYVAISSAFPSEAACRVFRVELGNLQDRKAKYSD
jgi:hypothetical protein